MAGSPRLRPRGATSSDNRQQPTAQNTSFLLLCCRVAFCPPLPCLTPLHPRLPDCTRVHEPRCDLPIGVRSLGSPFALPPSRLQPYRAR
jgi:hypothetical protein